MKKSIYSQKQAVLTDSLVSARKGANMTQQQVADKLEKPQSFVAKYENGERRLDVIEFLEVAKILGMSPSEILSKIEKTT